MAIFKLSSDFSPLFQRKRAVIIASLEGAVKTITADLQRQVAGKVNGSPIKSHTGKLANSVRVLPVENDGSRITGAVQAGGGPAYYGKFLEDGTAPHQIAAKNGKALAFMAGGKQVFAKYVNHPGNRPYKFMAKTLEENLPTIKAQLAAAVRSALTK